ncbi:MAG: hydroxyquinol 1,2-dioxygenase [Betaproteobacteria bacterium]|nr:hydroxyquinol 1,2-dioxygenase [Betaproteobacteria bacterium]MCC6250325.1 hydroxyquinol 1,2-dioxygenase [Rubrivivax sp.]MCL4698785.1 hydroxyquinol 1,2-dioxygenase [Burkholderiaceae bacterium]
MSPHQTADITQAVLDRLTPETDPRFREIITAVVKHVHALAREVDLKPDEWMRAIQFLTDVGHTCDEKRQEFILLSDTLGLSMLVVQLDQARRSKKALADKTAVTPATEATVQGPFYWEGAPVLELGSDIGRGMPGEPAHYSGRITDTHGRPIAGCCLDVWSGDGEGVYDMQMGGDAGMRLRARFHTDSEGRYHFWSIKPTFYPVPADGPVGDMLRAMGRHPNRPGHIHAMVYKDGYVPLTTHLFPADSPYLDSDAVFGVRDSLIVPYEKHAAGSKAPDGRVMDKPFHSARYDFVLAPA